MSSRRVVLLVVLLGLSACSALRVPAPPLRVPAVRAPPPVMQQQRPPVKSSYYNCKVGRAVLMP